MAISLGTKLLPLGSKFSIGTQFELTTDDPMSQFLFEGKKVSATSTLYLVMLWQASCKNFACARNSCKTQEILQESCTWLKLKKYKFLQSLGRGKF